MGLWGGRHPRCCSAASATHQARACAQSDDTDGCSMQGHAAALHGGALHCVCRGMLRPYIVVRPKAQTQQRVELLRAVLDLDPAGWAGGGILPVRTLQLRSDRHCWGGGRILPTPARQPRPLSVPTACLAPAAWPSSCAGCPRCSTATPSCSSSSCRWAARSAALAMPSPPPSPLPCLCSL